MAPAFDGVAGRAANLGRETGTYTLELFQEDYPQFFTPQGEEQPSQPLLPRHMLETFIAQANACIQPDKWRESWRMGVALYVAHWATLYLRGYVPGCEDGQQAAALGTPTGAVKSVTLGDAAITYDTQPLTQGTQQWGDLNATTYGQLLAGRARLVGAGGSYVI